MAGPEDESDKLLKTPQGSDQLGTPLTTPSPSEPARALSPVAVVSEGKVGERFELLGEVGRGGMGVVYKARDRETGAVVALKVLRPEIAGDTAVIERFKSELLLARKITHKNVCRTYDLHRSGDTVVIAMEFVEGESLRDILSRYSPLSVRKGVEWASQICAGLAEAHAQGVIHRDLKPANIVIDRGGHAKVMDFGIARSVEAGLTQTGVSVGTPAYMSPEQAAGKPVDARSDIYSLGLILYEMFTGQPALRAESPAVFLVKQMHETPPPPREVEPHLPSFLDRAIQACLEKDPQKRFQSVTELEAALTEKPEAKPATAPGGEVELPIHLTRWQRSDWLLVCAAVLGLALFFPFFERTSLAPRSKVSFDRSVLLRIAQEYAQRLGAPVSRVDRVDAWGAGARYDYLAKAAGAQSALNLANNPVPYWSWYVHWQNGTEVLVDNRGALQYYGSDFHSGDSDERLSVEEARPLAEKALRDLFECDPSLLHLEAAASEISSGPATTLFKWMDPKDYGGLKRHYEVRLVGRAVRFLRCTYEGSTGPVDNLYDWGYYFRQCSLIFAFVLPLIIIGFAQRRQVDQTARWRIIFIVTYVALAEWIYWPEWSNEAPALLILYSLITCVAIALSAFWCSVAIERSVRRIAPAKFLSLIPGLDAKSAASHACGLGVLRGSIVGLALLGLDSFLVWGGTSRLGMRLDSFRQIEMHGRFLYRSWPAAGVALYGFWQAACIGFAIVFLSSLAARFLRRAWLVVLVPTALAAATLPGPVLDTAAVQPYHWKVALLFLECLLLALCYARFDVLTTFWAVFTFAFCWQNYRLLVMFEPTGATEQWIAFAVFGLSVLAAGAMAFKSSLWAGLRRAAAAFE